MRQDALRALLLVGVSTDASAAGAAANAGHLTGSLAIPRNGGAAPAPAPRAPVDAAPPAPPGVDASAPAVLPAAAAPPTPAVSQTPLLEGSVVLCSILTYLMTRGGNHHQISECNNGRWMM